MNTVSISRMVPRPWNGGEYRISKMLIGPRGGTKWVKIFSTPATGGEVTISVPPGEYKETYWANGWPIATEFTVNDLGQCSDHVSYGYNDDEWANG